MISDPGVDCAAYTIIGSASSIASSCPPASPLTFTNPCVPPGTYYLWAGPEWNGVGFTYPLPSFNYKVTVVDNGAGSCAQGACCSVAGVCTTTNEEWQCLASSGAWAEGETCPAYDCSLNGACCSPTGGCTVTPEAGCAAPGIWLGKGAPCSHNSCVPQACCFSGILCADLPPAACLLAGGVSLGAGTACATHSCCDCPGDMSDDDLIDVSDIQGFVGCLLAPGSSVPCLCADLDHSGAVDGTDLVLFVGLLLLSPSPTCDTSFIPPGDDCWDTVCDGNGAWYEFDENAIPAGFFGSGSQAFTGVIRFGGRDPDQSDTIMHRLDMMVLNGFGPGVSATTRITLAKLDLVSCVPISVSYSGPPPYQEQWDVAVSLAPYEVDVGSMTVHKEHANGGTFESLFFVRPEFTFTKVGSPGVQTLIPSTPLMLEWEGGDKPPWVHVLPPDVDLETCGVNFIPGVKQVSGDRGPCDKFYCYPIDHHFNPWPKPPAKGHEAYKRRCYGSPGPGGGGLSKMCIIKKTEG